MIETCIQITSSNRPHLFFAPDAENYPGNNSINEAQTEEFM